MNPIPPLVILYTTINLMESILLPELKHMDFIWWIRGEWIEDEKVKDILYTIRNIKGVQLVAELTPEQIKNKGHLIFE